MVEWRSCLGAKVRRPAAEGDSLITRPVGRALGERGALQAYQGVSSSGADWQGLCTHMPTG